MAEMFVWLEIVLIKTIHPISIICHDENISKINILCESTICSSFERFSFCERLQWNIWNKMKNKIIEA